MSDVITQVLELSAKLDELKNTKDYQVAADKIRDKRAKVSRDRYHENTRVARKVARNILADKIKSVSEAKEYLSKNWIL